MPKRNVRMLLVLFCCLWVAMPSVSAPSYDVKEITPEVKEAMSNREDRYDMLENWKAKNAVGENNQGYVEAQVNSPQIAAWVALENKDRKVIYKAIAQQNNLGPEGLSMMESSFAEVQREKAQPGDSIQLPSGKWVKK